MLVPAVDHPSGDLFSGAGVAGSRRNTAVVVVIDLYFTQGESLVTLV